VSRFNAILTHPSPPLTTSLHPDTYVSSSVTLRGAVLDLLYVLLTLVFFGLMLLYVGGCHRLGHRNGSDRSLP
jgi:hypothetical protein